MDALIDEYKKAVEAYVKLSHLDTKTRVDLQKARAKLNRVRNELRAAEFDLAEPKVQLT